MSQLRKCISLGANGGITPGSDQDYRTNRDSINATNTEWVRIWADWPTFEPSPGQYSTFHLDNLRQQIEAANQDGKRVMLTSYRFPTWSNAARRANSAAHRPTKQSTPDNFCFPDAVDIDSPWGKWIDLLAEQFGAPHSGLATVDSLEFINEPNGQCWPQGVLAPQPGVELGLRADFSISACVVAQMFQTCKIIHDRVFNGILMGSRVDPPPFAFAGPATDDNRETAGSRQDYLTFTNTLLAWLHAFGFEQFLYGGFDWTHHNYTDMTYDQGLGSASPDAGNKATGRLVNRAAQVRKSLTANGWTGSFYLSEGGVRRDLLRQPPWSLSNEADIDWRHGWLLNRSWERMSNENADEGSGIGMLTQFLVYSVKDFDTGLRNPSPGGGGDGAVRPGPWNTWASKPNHPNGAP